MFYNIGRKIKTLAKAITWIGITASVIYGAVVLRLSNSPTFIIQGLLTMIVGSLISWLSSVTLYGFGQLIENTDILVSAHRNKETEFRSFARKQPDDMHENTDWCVPGTKI